MAHGVFRYSVWIFLIYFVDFGLTEHDKHWWKEHVPEILGNVQDYYDEFTEFAKKYRNEKSSDKKFQMFKNRILGSVDEFNKYMNPSNEKTTADAVSPNSASSPEMAEESYQAFLDMILQKAPVYFAAYKSLQKQLEDEENEDAQFELFKKHLEDSAKKLEEVVNSRVKKERKKHGKAQKIQVQSEDEDDNSPPNRPAVFPGRYKKLKDLDFEHFYDYIV